MWQVKVTEDFLFISEDKPESGLDTVDSRLDNIGGRITALYSKMCWELGADLQVHWRILDFPGGGRATSLKFVQFPQENLHGNEYHWGRGRSRPASLNSPMRYYHVAINRITWWQFEIKPTSKSYLLTKDILYNLFLQFTIVTSVRCK